MVKKVRVSVAIILSVQTSILPWSKWIPSLHGVYCMCHPPHTKS